MKILLTVIMTWLSSNFDLPVTHEQPDVKFVTHQQMAEIRLGPLATSPGYELVAIYEDRSKTIFLSDRWTGDTPADLSVLVHESSTTCRTWESSVTPAPRRVKRSPMRHKNNG